MTKAIDDKDADRHRAKMAKRKAVQDEHARTLMGVLYRRSGIGLRHHFSDDEVTRVAEVMAAELLD